MPRNCLQTGKALKISKSRQMVGIARLYGFLLPPISGPGRGGSLQLLGVPLSSCCRFNPARVVRRFSQFASSHAAFALGFLWVSGLSRPHLRSLSLRPDDLLTILTMALSIGIRNSISLLSAIQATGLLTITLVGLSPTEHTSFSWTRCRTAEFLRSGLKPWPLVRKPSLSPRGSSAGAHTPRR